MGTIGVEKDFSLLESKKLHINPGVRLNIYSGSDLDYITAPAALTSDDANLDTLSFASVQNNFVNLFVRFGYDLTEKISISFDIDLISVSFGGEQADLPFKEGANSLADMVDPPATAAASPTTLNYLIMGDLDNGSLNSTLSLSYAVSENFGI